MDISGVNWWVKKSTDTQYFLIIVFSLILLAVLIEYFRRRFTSE